MSNRKNPYLFYTEYYLISGAYQVINVVNGILTYSASYSDNIKEYLRNQVASKQVALNELVHNRNREVTRINANPDGDIDEDGFVIIKMRRSKKNKNESSGSVCTNNIHNVIVQQIVDDMIKEVIKKLDVNTNTNNES
jgi:hypothetical protein